MAARKPSPAAPPVPRFDRKRSRELRRKIQAKPNECYRNAVVGLCLSYAEGEYIEGFVVLADKPIIPIAHGWIEHEGRIIDPTLTESIYTYYPGPRYTKKMLIAGMNRGTVDLPIVYGVGRGMKKYRMGFGGMGSPEYRKAYTDAMTACGWPPQIVQALAPALHLLTT